MSDDGRGFNTLLNNTEYAKQQSIAFKVSRIVEKAKKELPEIFNPFDRWGIYLARVKTQGSCGCCWAMSTSKVLSERYALLSDGKLNVELSPYMMVMCEGTIFPSIPANDKKLANINLEAHSQGACNGNTLFTAMNYLYAVGLCDTTCVNRGKFSDYGIKDLETIEDPENVPMCQSILGDNYDRCLDRDRAVRFYRTIAGYQVPSDIESIKQEIYKWGPVSAGFQVYDNFMKAYNGTTIYMGPEKDSKLQGGHAIEIVGWGKENGVDFWWICNSWGTDWGLSGYFRMKMGIEKCQLEQNVVGFIPDFPGFGMDMLDYELVKNTEMETLREWIGIDSITGYKFSTLSEIKEGKLKGNIIPLMNKKSIPDMMEVWLGEIESDDNEIFYGVSHFESDNTIPTKEIIIVCGALVLFYFGGRWLKIFRK
jgi:hypothetical protein